ncbi:MAG: hypothetical protein ACXADH_12565 [Candidatus Kariarchaeaceae archaeon]
MMDDESKVFITMIAIFFLFCMSMFFLDNKQELKLEEERTERLKVLVEAGVTNNLLELIEGKQNKIEITVDKKSNPVIVGEQ